MSLPKILIVDDEPSVLELIVKALKNEHYQLFTASSVEEAQKIMNNIIPDLIISDVMMPGTDGMEFCKIIKREYGDIPIIFLSAVDNEIDKVLGLELGAEDYITKPFGLRELQARVKVVLRRSKQRDDSLKKSPLIEIRGLKINLKGRTVTVDDQEIILTRKEFDILYLLCSNPGRVYTREEILNIVWEEYENGILDRTVDVHIRHLRDKIEKDPQNPVYIETIRGVGYKCKI